MPKKSTPKSVQKQTAGEKIIVAANRYINWLSTINIFFRMIVFLATSIFSVPALIIAKAATRTEVTRDTTKQDSKRENTLSELEKENHIAYNPPNTLAVKELSNPSRFTSSSDTLSLYFDLLDKAAQDLIIKYPNYKTVIEQLVAQWKEDTPKVIGFEKYKNDNRANKNIKEYMELALQIHAVQKVLIKMNNFNTVNGQPEWSNWLQCQLTPHRHDGGAHVLENINGRVQCKNDNILTRFNNLTTAKGGNLQVTEDLHPKQLRKIAGKIVNENIAGQYQKDTKLILTKKDRTQKCITYQQMHENWLDYFVNKSAAIIEFIHTTQENNQKLSEERKREYQKGIQRITEYYKNKPPQIANGNNLMELLEDNIRGQNYQQHMIIPLILNAHDKGFINLSQQELQLYKQMLWGEKNEDHYEKNVSFIWGHFHDGPVFVRDFYPGHLDKILKKHLLFDNLLDKAANKLKKHNPHYAQRIDDLTIALTEGNKIPITGIENYQEGSDERKKTEDYIELALKIHSIYQGIIPMDSATRGIWGNQIPNQAQQLPADIQMKDYFDPTYLRKLLGKSINREKTKNALNTENTTWFAEYKAWLDECSASVISFFELNDEQKAQFNQIIEYYKTQKPQIVPDRGNLTPTHIEQLRDAVKIALLINAIDKGFLALTKDQLDTLKPAFDASYEYENNASLIWGHWGCETTSIGDFYPGHLKEILEKHTKYLQTWEVVKKAKIDNALQTENDSQINQALKDAFREFKVKTGANDGDALKYFVTQGQNDFPNRNITMEDMQKRINLKIKTPQNCSTQQNNSSPATPLQKQQSPLIV